MPCGVNLEHFHLRVVKGDEKETWYLRILEGHHVTGEINTETWYSRLGIQHKADDLAPLK
jgi:hypothetical protein